MRILLSKNYEVVSRLEETITDSQANWKSFDFLFGPSPPEESFTLEKKAWELYQIACSLWTLAFFFFRQQNKTYFLALAHESLKTAIFSLFSLARKSSEEIPYIEMMRYLKTEINIPLAFEGFSYLEQFSNSIKNNKKVNLEGAIFENSRAFYAMNMKALNVTNVAFRSWKIHGFDSVAIEAYTKYKNFIHQILPDFSIDLLPTTPQTNQLQHIANTSTSLKSTLVTPTQKDEIINIQHESLQQLESPSEKPTSLISEIQKPVDAIHSKTTNIHASKDFSPMEEENMSRSNATDGQGQPTPMISEQDLGDTLEILDQTTDWLNSLIDWSGKTLDVIVNETDLNKLEKIINKIDETKQQVESINLTTNKSPILAQEELEVDIIRIKKLQAEVLYLLKEVRANGEERERRIRRERKRIQSQSSLTNFMKVKIEELTIEVHQIQEWTTRVYKELLTLLSELRNAKSWGEIRQIEMHTIGYEYSLHINFDKYSLSWLPKSIQDEIEKVRIQHLQTLDLYSSMLDEVEQKKAELSKQRSW